MHFFRAILQLLLLITTVSAETFINPLKQTDGSDPFIVYEDGYYYLTTTTWTDIQITRATTLEGLKAGEVKTVWTDETASRWYIFYTAGSSDTLDDQRSFVLKGGSSPWDTYSYLAQLTPEWGIDGTVLRLDSKNYFVWSCMVDSLQSLCIATLDDPSTLGTTYTLSKPTEDWETVEVPVNEGPAPLYHDGKTWLAYSASYCWTANYSLGLLTYDGAGDPLEATSWTKSGGPVFISANGNYGTGHNGPDGTQIWNVFHAESNPEGACDGTRYTMALEVDWNSDGTPNFGSAPALDTVLEGPSGE
ncbi:hypothetical protein MW887_004485 [Aspergillus wentii]|nr:hypothetical protein MW887_004485 [Aspergillus wentii]